MVSLMFWAKAICNVKACPPQPTIPTISPPPATRQSTASTGPSSPSSPSARKREVESVEVMVVSNQKYDPSMNDSHMKVFKSLVDDYVKSKGVTYNKDLVHDRAINVNDYVKSKGVTYNKDLVHDKAINVGGKFAVLYTLLGYDCNRVNNFVHGAKGEANFVTDIRVKCQGKPEFVVV
ncbi:unnamed protein product [Strongylus vulgaris]|uniref:Uncharacterized protein n=1 Tax=Strongylus vulgaris TaxID=40348 RepID=A0A3P7JUU9_STRVU|nr:unnamed protein product [Strongylus vulgaris]